MSSVKKRKDLGWFWDEEKENAANGMPCFLLLWIPAGKRRRRRRRRNPIIPRWVDERQNTWHDEDRIATQKRKETLLSSGNWIGFSSYSERSTTKSNNKVDGTCSAVTHHRVDWIGVARHGACHSDLPSCLLPDSFWWLTAQEGKERRK